LKVTWAILCERSVVDGDTNNLSLFNVIEEVIVASTPPQAPPAGESLSEGVSEPGPRYLGLAAGSFELVTLWARSTQEAPERGCGRVRLIFPAGESHLGPEYEVDLTRYLRLRHRMRISGLPIRGEGNYRFVTDGRGDSGEWAEMFEVPLRVVIQTEGT